MPIATLSKPVNEKLGPLINSFSTPAGYEFGCIGASVVCQFWCYAKKGRFRMPNVNDCYTRNLSFSATDDFAEWAIASIKQAFAQIVRIHVSGDFRDVDYTRKWRYIVSKCPRTTFFAYTRSWREEDILPELLYLSSYPNMQLWWSMDRETGPAPYIQGIRRSYMAISDVDAKMAPADCDLVFRVEPETVLKKANGVQVCPPENGLEANKHITCSRCRMCWRRSSAKWEDVPLPVFDPVSIDMASPGVTDERRRIPILS
jgi:hypothetical protein